jgi:hypothetical protein
VDCGNGEILSWNLGQSRWECAAAGGVGTITEVAAGAGLTGGASSGVATLAIDNEGVVAAMLGPSAVTTAKIEYLAVTSAKLAADSVTTAKIEDLAVTSAKLAADSVTTAKIEDGAVTNDKIDAVAAAKVTGLGGAALLSVGTGAGTVAAGDDDRLNLWILDSGNISRASGNVNRCRCNSTLKYPRDRRASSEHVEYWQCFYDNRFCNW